MKAHPLMLRGLIVLALIVIVPIGVGIALAHGTPTIAVEATIVAAGSPISITGSGMAAGESFTITLDGMAGSIELGTVTAHERRPSRWFHRNLHGAGQQHARLIHGSRHGRRRRWYHG